MPTNLKFDVRCAALEVHADPENWAKILERVDGELHAQLAVVQPQFDPDEHYRVTVYGEHVDEFLNALPTRDERRKQIKALRPARVVGEPR